MLLVHVAGGNLMSRGSGAVQRKIIEAFAAEPYRRFTVEELAAAVFPGKPIEKA